MESRESRTGADLHAHTLDRKPHGLGKASGQVPPLPEGAESAGLLRFDQASGGLEALRFSPESGGFVPVNPGKNDSQPR